MTPLPALLARLSDATKGSPELDSAIGYYLSHADYGWWRDRAGPSDFTRSLDAALTLIPADYIFLGIVIQHGEDKYKAAIGAPELASEPIIAADDPAVSEGLAPTPALALCLASLKARIADGH